MADLFACGSFDATAVGFLEDAKLTQKSIASATHTSFTVEHIAPAAPSEPRDKRWSRSVELLLAFLLNLIFLIVLFYRPDYELPKMMKPPPAISVDLVPPQPKAQPQPKAEQQKQQPKPKEEEKKPEAKEKQKEEKQKEEKKPVDKYRESGGDPNLMPGRVPKIEADKSKLAPEKKAEKPKPDAPKKPAANVPDWAKALNPGYDLPKQADSSVTKSRGTNERDSLSDRVGNGGGDAYLNQLVAQVGAHVVYPSTANGEVGVVEIMIVVDRGGNLRSMRLTQSAGLRVLDWAASEAIRRAAPFLPLPPDYPAPVAITLKIPIAPT